MAVVDVFTAITEDRPYREGMAADRAVLVLHKMAEDSALDSGIVSLVEQHLDEVDYARTTAQEAARKAYGEFEELQAQG